MKKLLALICALVLAMGLAACSGGSSQSSSSAAEDTATESAAAESTAVEEEEAGAEKAVEAVEEEAAEEEAEASAEDAAEEAEPVATVDVSNVDIDVAAMSDEEAFQFMDGFINRTPDELDADEGKVMHIVGQVSRYTKEEDGVKKVSDSVGIKGEGGVIKGVNFYVEGWTGDDYPENKAQVEVTGVWGKVDGYGNAAGRCLICNAQDVKVL